MDDKYVESFANLKTDRSRSRWNASTNYRAPHKPLVLLSVLDQFAEGKLTGNLIEFDDDLLSLFGIYWAVVKPPSRAANIALPLWHLQSDDFWHLLPRPGYEDRVWQGGPIRSLGRLREATFGAKLDEPLFRRLQESRSREYMRAILIRTYFSEELQTKLVEQGVTNQQAYLYSKELLAKAESKELREVAGSGYEARARDQGFRRAITTIYDHRCALCGIRVLTPEGHTAVDAAHIVPWRISQNDDPRNGMALCRLCHWTFDEGLLGVGTDYVMQASPRLRTEQNYPAHLTALHGREIMKPEKPVYWPMEESLAWHLGNVFRRR